MEHDAGRYGGHAALLRGFLDGKTLQLHVLEQSSLPVGQTLQQPLEIRAQSTFLRVVGSEEGVGILERDLNRPSPAAQMIDELVAREGIRPGCKWQRAIVAVALQMHGKQRLLDEILDLAARGTDAAGEVPTQVAAEEAEELTMGAGIPLQAEDHQRPEALFGLVLLQHWRADSLAVREPRESNASDPQCTNPERHRPV